MNERIARALVEDLLSKSRSGGTLEFHDDSMVYTVTVSSALVPNKSVRESKGWTVSPGSSGAPCTCCNGSGRS